MNRIKYGLVAIFLLLLSSILFTGAIAILRTNVLLTKADRELSTQVQSTKLDDFLDDYWNRKIIEALGGADDLSLREAYTLLYKGDTQQAESILLELAKSKNKKLASLALTLLGKITVQLAVERKDTQLFELARQRFARAIILDPDNEDAKFNLELLNKLARESDWIMLLPNQGAIDQEDIPLDQEDIPLDQLPGERSGTPEDYSDY